MENWYLIIRDCPKTLIEDYSDFKENNNFQIINEIHDNFKDDWAMKIIYSIKIIYRKFEN